MLTTGRPPAATKSSPSSPPGSSPSYCSPQASSGLPGVLAEKPPKAEHEPMANTHRARRARPSTHSVSGRPLPAIRWNFPVPLGPCSMAPSTQSTSNGVVPSAQSPSRCNASAPLSGDSAGCQTNSMPASRSSSNKGRGSAHSSDWVQPPQPPLCSQRTFIRLPRARSAPAWRAGRHATGRVRGRPATCCRDGAAWPIAAPGFPSAPGAP